MAEPNTNETQAGSAGAAPVAHKPYVADEAVMPEFTWSAVILGSVLGIIFAASSLYLVLKVGMTVSASIPVAVLAITLFRALSKSLGLRRATILENNIVQTAGSAGESIAFGVGVTMPALLLLGFHMDLPRVMVVSILGGILGILAMIPLRRAFIVKLHGRPGEPGKLLYPEGTACAQVLISGEKGGTTGKTIFFGFGLAFLHKFLTEGMNLLMGTVKLPLSFLNRAAVFAGEMASELLGVGYIIGLRTSAVMMSGAILGYLILIPLIAFVGDFVTAQPVPPGSKLIKDMSVKEIRDNYLLFIGAGCVATAGIISMIRTLPMIVRSLSSGLSSMRNSSSLAATSVRRTENDMSMKVVLFGSLGLISLLAIFLTTEVPIYAALVGALLVVLFGFLFVTVSARLTGEIGSSSNPISGMTVATLTLTCLIFLALGWTSSTERVLALSIAAVVCVAASNGGTTAQSLKTGFLVGGTPRLMQYAILFGAMTSALVIGGTLLAFNKAGTVYSEKPENLPKITLTAGELATLTMTETYEGETYHVWDTRRGTLVWDPRRRMLDDSRLQMENVRPGCYLVDDSGKPRWLRDDAIMGKLSERDDGTTVRRDFDAPKTQVMGIVINGVLSGELNWNMVLFGSLIAVLLELCGISSLAFAVGLYVPIQFSTPIFLGGLIRWVVDLFLARSAHAEVATDDAEARARAEIEAIRKSETSPGVLLAAGFIAGGSLAGMLISFIQFSDDLPKDLSAWQYRTCAISKEESFDDAAMEAAQQQLGLTSADYSIEADRQTKALREKVTLLAQEIKNLNEDVPVLWVTVAKGTALKLPEYRTFEVSEDSKLGEVAAKVLGSREQAQALWGLNKKKLPPLDKTEQATDVPVAKGTVLTLPLRKTYALEQDTYLADVAREVLGRRDRAQTLMNLNKDQLKLPEKLPAGATLKLPQHRLPALACFALLVLVLLAVGMGKLFKVQPESDNPSASEETSNQPN